MSGEEIVKGIGWKILPWFADVLCALLCWWAVGLNAEIKELRKDVNSLREWKSETAGNRYTASDHSRYQEQINAEFGKVWNRMSEQQQLWLKDIGDIRVSIAELRSELKSSAFLKDTK